LKFAARRRIQRAGTDQSGLMTWTTQEVQKGHDRKLLTLQRPDFNFDAAGDGSGAGVKRRVTNSPGRTLKDTSSSTGTPPRFLKTDAMEGKVRTFAEGLGALTMLKDYFVWGRLTWTPA